MFKSTGGKALLYARTDYFFSGEDSRIGEYANIGHGHDHMKADHSKPMHIQPGQPDRQVYLSGACMAIKN